MVNSFDLVIVKDVLEHVDDVAKSIDELLRVARKYIYIMSPNYLFPYEAHFKVPFPPKLPKAIAHWYLMLFGFSSEERKFIDHINYVTKPSLLRIIRRSHQQASIYAVIDLQLAKAFRRYWVLTPVLDLFTNYKVELLIVKNKVVP